MLDLTYFTYPYLIIFVQYLYCTGPTYGKKRRKKTLTSNWAVNWRFLSFLLIYSTTHWDVWITLFYPSSLSQKKHKKNVWISENLLVCATPNTEHRTSPSYFAPRGVFFFFLVINSHYRNFFIAGRDDPSPFPSEWNAWLHVMNKTNCPSFAARRSK